MSNVEAMKVETVKKDSDLERAESYISNELDKLYALTSELTQRLKRVCKGEFPEEGLSPGETLEVASEHAVTLYGFGARIKSFQHEISNLLWRLEV